MRGDHRRGGPRAGSVAARLSYSRDPRNGFAQTAPRGWGIQALRLRSVGWHCRPVAHPHEGRVTQSSAGVMMQSIRVITVDEDVVGLLNTARRSMGLKHKEFAKLLNISYNTWCRWRRVPGECPQIVILEMSYPLEILSAESVEEGDDGGDLLS